MRNIALLAKTWRKDIPVSVLKYKRCDCNKGWKRTCNLLAKNNKKIYGNNYESTFNYESDDTV
jgi:hypothetical protein